MRCCRRNAAEDIAAPDHHRDLDTEIDDFRDFIDDTLDRCAVNSITSVTHQRFAAEFEQYPPVRGSWVHVM